MQRKKTVHVGVKVEQCSAVCDVGLPHVTKA